MKLLLIVGGAVAAVGLFLLATASADTSLFAQHYPLILLLNAALAGLLAGLVAFQLLAMARRYRARVFGSRLTLRLLLRFAALAVLPGLIVYAVSVQFLTRSIESWFDVKVDAALEGGINLAQQAIDQMSLELQAKARAMALELADRPAAAGCRATRAAARPGRRAGGGARDRRAGACSPARARTSPSWCPSCPTAQSLHQARTNRGFTAIDAPAGRPLALRVVVPVDVTRLPDEARFLQLRAGVPASFARSAEAVEVAYRDYRELAISRQGLKRIYIVTLTFALLMALFVAIAVAVTQSSLLAEPLADARAGNAGGRARRLQPSCSRSPVGTSSGVLTESFNSMTRQLDEARRVVEANRVDLEAAKVRLENILANLSAGVLVFDHELRLSISNHGATAILARGARCVSPSACASHFVEHGDARTGSSSCRSRAPARRCTRAAAALPRATGGGYVVVFDDITQLIQAQRATAWAEVARRLAHEIKNPLTPIQLSAERLEMKLAERLSREDAETLRRATQTIVSQVAALKSMVDDFRRLRPPARARPRAARPQRAGQRSAGALRGLRGADREATGRGPAAGVGRRGADPPGHPQSGAERPGRARERSRGQRRARRSRCAPSSTAKACASPYRTMAAVFRRS